METFHNFISNICQILKFFGHVNYVLCGIKLVFMCLSAYLTNESMTTINILNEDHLIKEHLFYSSANQTSTKLRR